MFFGIEEIFARLAELLQTLLERISAFLEALFGGGE